MKSKKRVAKKKKTKAKVKRVRLTPAAIVEVSAPKNIVPVVMANPDKGVVKIIPVPVTKLSDKTWFDRWFG